MTTLVSSGKSLHQVFNNLNNIDIATEIDDLDQRIRSINLESAGVHNVPIFKQLIETISIIKKELVTSRISLKSFAKSTISRVTSLEHAIITIEEKPTKIRFGLKLAANQMLNIIKLHDETLPEAESHMAVVNDLIKRVDELLPRLKQTIQSHYTAQIHQRQSKQIDAGHVRRKRSDSTVNSVSDKTTATDAEPGQKKQNYDPVISVLHSTIGEEAVNVAGGVIDALGEDGKDVPLLKQVAGSMKEGILGSVVDASKDSKGRKLSSEFAKHVIGLLGTTSEHVGSKPKKITYKMASAALTQIIGAAAATSKLADYLTGTRIEEIKKTMEESRKELEKAATQIQEYNRHGRSLDESYLKILQERKDRQRDFMRQQNLLQQILYQNQQNTLQSAINSLEFMHTKFSDSAIQLRSKIIPLEENKSRLSQLIQVLSLESAEGDLLELNPDDKARVVNMIINVKNACNNFLYKRITQDYSNFDSGL